MENGKRSRPIRQYIALGFILLAALAYEFRTTQERFPQWFGGHERVAWPFLLDADESAPVFRLNFVKPNALWAGLTRGDVLVEVNGRSVIGSGVLGEEIANAQVGETVSVATRSDWGTRRSKFRLISTESEPIGFVALIGVLIMPVFCLLFGLWVVAIRPRDRLAWLLLAFLLRFTTFFNPSLEAWGFLARDLGAIYQAALNRSYGIWLLLFAFYFPEPLAEGSPGRTTSRWAMWMIAAPLGLWTIAGVITSVGTLENYISVFALAYLVGQVKPLFTFCSYASTAGSLLFLGWKWHFAQSQDARRRLQFVLIGALISFPLFPILRLIAQFRHTQVEQLFPSWLYGASYLLQFTFPLTIAYVILVHRAMDVRLIIRQGLQYTLAKRGVIILQVLLSLILIGVVGALVTAHAMNYTATVLFMAVGFSGILLLNGVTRRLAVIVDRRFFREAYNAEQILSDLAERVRTIVETERLLETVTQRISEALHVSPMSVLLNGNGSFRVACASGYGTALEVDFTDTSATIRQLKDEQQPVRVYFDDPDGWIDRSGMSTAERETLGELRSELLLPLLVKNELIGFMTLGQKRSEAPYSSSDLRVLNSVASQTSLALEVSRLTEKIAHDAAQQERFNRELEIAREVQQQLFPQRLPSVSGLDYCAECRPAREVGGDYYDFVELPNGKLGIAIGDVSGKVLEQH